jgi:hypothetical protein
MPPLPLFPWNLLKLLTQPGEEESFGVVELETRIWKSDLDSKTGIDLLKNPEPFGVPRVRLN